MNEKREAIFDEAIGRRNARILELEAQLETMRGGFQTAESQMLQAIEWQATRIAELEAELEAARAVGRALAQVNQLTAKEAERAYEEAPNMPLTEDQTERILRMAEAEDACESVSVGGLAIDVGFAVEAKDFKCTVCGVECPVSDPVEGAICEEHCGDHNYEYDRGERKWSCVHCDKERPYDW